MPDGTGSHCQCAVALRKTTKGTDALAWLDLGFVGPTHKKDPRLPEEKSVNELNPDARVGDGPGPFRC